MGRFNEYLEIEVKVSLSKTGNKIIDFFGLKDKQDAEAILSRICVPGQGPFARKGLPGKNILQGWYKSANGKTSLGILVDSKFVNEFIDTGLKSIISGFVASKKYNNDAILRLEDVVAHKLEVTDTLSDKFKNMASAEQSVYDLWQRYLNNINNPVTKEALALYSKIYSNSVYGHALSLANVLRIRAINPNATFVLSESTWNQWGFGIKRGATKYPMWRPANEKDATQKDIDEAMKNLGHELEKFGDLGVAVQDAIRIEATRLANKGRPKIFIPYYGYDIADTYRFDPKSDDPLVTKPNAKSNVVYQLNALAQELEDKKRAENGDVNKALEDETNKKYEIAINVANTLCANKGITVDTITNSSTNQESKLISLLSRYYAYVINEPVQTKKGQNLINVLRPENINKYIQDAIQLTLLMCNIPFNQNNFQHSIQYTQNEAATLGKIIKTATEQILKSLSMNEGIFDGGWFGNAFKNALRKLGIKVVRENPVTTAAPVSTAPETQMERIKREFKEMLNRINNPIIY